MTRKMELEIIRLLAEYSLSDKPIDNDYIERLINIVKKSRSLEEYLTDFKILPINEENPKAVACYRPFFKRIEIYSDNFDSHISDLSYAFSGCFNGHEERFLNNLIGTQLLLHELEHVYQEKKTTEDDSMESELLRMTHLGKNIFLTGLNNVISGVSSTDELLNNMLNFAETVSKEREVYDSFYDYELGERLANIDSYSTLISGFSFIKEKVPNLIKLSKYFKVGYLLSGYDDDEVLSPTILFMQAKGDQEKLRAFNWYSENFDESLILAGREYRLADRMRLGLPITKEELYYVKDYQSKIISY